MIESVWAGRRQACFRRIAFGRDVEAGAAADSVFPEPMERVRRPERPPPLGKRVDIATNASLSTGDADNESGGGYREDAGGPCSYVSR